MISIFKQFHFTLRINFKFFRLCGTCSECRQQLFIDEEDHLNVVLIPGLLNDSGPFKDRKRKKKWIQKMLNSGACAIWEAQAEGSRIQGHPVLHATSQDNKFNSFPLKSPINLQGDVNSDISHRKNLALQSWLKHFYFITFTF